MSVIATMLILPYLSLLVHGVMDTHNAYDMEFGTVFTSSIVGVIPPTYMMNLMTPFLYKSYKQAGIDHSCDHLSWLNDIYTRRNWSYGMFLNGYNNLSNSAVDDLKELARSPAVNSDVPEERAHVIVFVKRFSHSKNHIPLHPIVSITKQCGEDHPIVKDFRRRISEYKDIPIDLNPLPTDELFNQDYYTTGCWSVLLGHKGKYYVLAELGTNTSMSAALKLLIRLTKRTKDLLLSNLSMLILWGHGNMYFGMPSGAPEVGIGANDLRWILERELQWGDGSYDAYDIIGFDACLMANYEILSMIGKYSKYILASEIVETSYGWDYSRFNARDNATQKLSAKTVGLKIVDGYADFQIGSGNSRWSLSLIDARKLEEFTLEFDLLISLTASCFGGRILTRILNDGIEAIPQLKDCNQGELKQCYCWDLKNFVVHLNENIGNYLSPDAYNDDLPVIVETSYEPISVEAFYRQLHVAET